MTLDSRNSSILGIAGVVLGGALLGTLWWNDRIKATSPELNGLKPVSSVDLHRYAGLWYEQKRIDISFESRLTNVTARYAVQSDGTISVCNTGNDMVTNAFSSLTARGRPTQYPGVLMVAFFTFIEGAYVILYIDKDYQTAVVGSPDKITLWLLTRDKVVSKNQLSMLHSVALDNGYTQAQLDAMVTTNHA